MDEIEHYKNLILGLKFRQFRKDLDLSFSDLAKLTGISVSYLNEIEKGKKYPSGEKIKTLATVFNTDFEQLSSLELSGKLQPLEELFSSGFLNALPIEHFGIDVSKVVEIFSASPVKIGAFISTILDISKSYALEKQHFYLKSLRAYIELHEIYFSDIEKQANGFINEFLNKSNDKETFESILFNTFKIKVDYKGLESSKGLNKLRSIFKIQNQTLYINGKLNDKQKIFLLAKEVGFQYLDFKERSYITPITKIKSFGQVLNNYLAGYFAVSILVPRTKFMIQVANLIDSPVWDTKYLDQLIQKFDVSYSTIFQRFNLLPSFFGIKNIFFQRFHHHLDTDTFSLNKELHINQKHYPHSNSIAEHYCRRWLSIRLLKALDNQSHPYHISAQKSVFASSKETYMEFGMAWRSDFTKNVNYAMSIGFILDEDNKKIVNFSEDPNIPSFNVSVTCENCGILDCKDRVAEPVRLQRKKDYKVFIKNIDNFLEL